MRRWRRDPRVADEIRFHRNRLIEDYVAAGMGRHEAERRAFLGDWTVVSRQCSGGSQLLPASTSL
jgi:hypothetical protein